ncbi:xanthine dehydrogenase molybdopterin binding subunit [Pseudoalteromonas denitrificans]|uniref:Xanthine dehydrogenase, molybdenum binding subunit apoprotein n=1 Tax=Pseudoalteromonas denitrificans DSM 6059 TaxID=1123010 RepID=A0A1I1L638_9GAMM|nr:xanthine dehydrogenase molybdopterin binding subunit [Pseudoalteromonas denitrificans]SFC68486.1 xanthine dehydrogenase, molybdenum binding subunit apoprotein [Pseudoalteromonas denitrificans DSM 6059]
MRKLAQLQDKTSSKITGKVGVSRKHESADKHVTGKALYIDDRPQMANQLFAAIGQTTIAHGLVKSMDLSKVKVAPGVVDVLIATDVPGHLDIGPVFKGDPVLVLDKVEFMGQALFAVAATSHEAAVKAAKLAIVEYEEIEPVLSVKEALSKQNFVRPPHTQKRGDAVSAINASKHILEGKLKIGGQEHFYLESQISSAEPTEDGGMMIYSSSQHPSEVQKLVAEVLGISFNKVVVDMRRMGGGFGGKETQAAPWACIAALLANKTGRCVKLRLNRVDDMTLTGKRHPFENDYKVGFDEQGLIKGIEFNINGNCGYSPDLSDAIVDRAMFHSDNAYFLENAHVVGNRCKTNTVSHTAYRGFGGPQGMISIEGVMDDIARKVDKDPLEIRKLNLYGQNDRNITHYGQTVEHNILPMMINKLENDCEYQKRRTEITQFNKINTFLKKGIALTPVKFGISFTVQHLNQAGALIHLYTDGSIQLNHGGTEMGQGLNTKIAQVVAQEFQVDIDNIIVCSTRTDKVPNTSPTAASSGTDLNGKAAQNAAIILKNRLIEFTCEHFSVEQNDVIFSDNQVHISNVKQLSFAELVQLAYMNRISLSSTGFYKTPKIYYDRDKANGRPFFYFANGVACSEVVIDTLTGEYKVARVDVLHDVGDSLNPAIDLGQIEGAFVQGMGWLTTEELIWNEKGRLVSNNPATYKIPAIADMPEVFNVELLQNEPNAEATIYNSKAVGEPPFMLAISVWSALRDAVSSVSDYKASPILNTPATPERVLMAVQQMKSL